MNTYIQKLKSNKFLNHSMIMVIGTLLSQVILIIASPIITRLYSPEAFGVFTTFMTICMLILPIANGRFDLLIVKAKNSDEKNVYITISIIISLVLFMLSLFIITALFAVESSYSSMVFFVIIPFIGIASLYNIITSLLIREQQFNALSKISIHRSIGQTAFQIVGGLFKMGSIGLMVSFVISYLIGINKYLKRFINEFNFVTSKDEIKRYFKENKSQLFFSTPSILINGLSFSLIIFFIGVLYSPYYVGLYAITIKILGIPLTVVSGAVSKVFYEKAASDFNNMGSFRSVLIRTSLILLMCSLFIFAPFLFVNEEMFGVIFGEEWAIASSLIKYLIPMYLVRFIVSTVSLGVMIVNKQKEEMKLQTLFIISTLLSFVAAKYYHLGIESFLLLISVLFTCCYIYFYINLYKFSEKNL